MFERKFQHLQQSSSAKPPEPPPPTDPLEERAPFDPHTAAKYDDDHERKITFRLKSAAGAGLVLMVLYAITTLFSGPSSRDGGFEPTRRLSEQEEFEALRARHDIGRARSKQGFFQRIFCGSYQRSAFCD